MCKRSYISYLPIVHSKNLPVIRIPYSIIAAIEPPFSDYRRATFLILLIAFCVKI